MKQFRVDVGEADHFYQLHGVSTSDLTTIQTSFASRHKSDLSGDYKIQNQCFLMGRDNILMQTELCNHG